MSESGSPIKVRPSGVLLQGDRVLLIRQSVTAKRKWSLPGGRLEKAETIEHCLVRELKEETGIGLRRLSGPRKLQRGLRQVLRGALSLSPDLIAMPEDQGSGIRQLHGDRSQ